MEIFDVQLRHQLNDFHPLNLQKVISFLTQVEDINQLV